ncbi:MAG: deoxyribonuclease V [Thermodesulfovibrionia bacterium]|nr:deoxyribonuclease V [Thermodesulfovibrionia bacterium]
MKWPKNIKEAQKIQHEIKEKIKIIPLKKKLVFVAGVDAAFSRNNVIATACVYKYPELSLFEQTYALAKILFPYIPGFLSFREGPALIKAISCLRIKPDLVMFDGQGIAHPSNTGIAAHLGVLLNIPAVGCAKSRLVGHHREPGSKKGSLTYLKYRNETVGAVLRTRDNVKPLFVSPGHLIDLEGAIDVVLTCTTRYRIPEPVRQADYIAKKLKLLDPEA